jgi:hypothetical protein
MSGAVLCQGFVYYVSESFSSQNFTTIYIFLKLTMVTRSQNHFCLGNVIIITYSNCVSVALVIEHAMRMRRIILSFVACLHLPNFSILFQKGLNFGEKRYGL